MLPHGGRPAETPRATHRAEVQQRTPGTVSETAIRPSRSARSSRAAPRLRVGGRRRGTAGRRSTAPTATSSRRCQARARRGGAAAERELGGVAVHRDRVDGHRGVEQVVAEVGQALTGHSRHPSSRLLGCVVARLARSARPAGGDLVGQARPRPRLGPREARHLDERTPAVVGREPGPRPAGAGRTARASGRPGPAARRPARAGLPGSCGDRQRGEAAHAVEA